MSKEKNLEILLDSTNKPSIISAVKEERSVEKPSIISPPKK